MEKSAITESDLDHNARKAREELLDRKRARDLQRQKLAEQNKEVVRRFAAIGSKANDE